MIVKKCKIHGELTEDQVKKEKNSLYKAGFIYRCNQCKLEIDSRWKEANWKQHKASAGKARNEARKLYREGLIDAEPKANQWAKQDRKENPEKYRRYEANYIAKHGIQKIRKMEVARIHGLTLAEYEAMFEKQNHLCLICNKEETRVGRTGEIMPLCVDHCHTCEDKGHYKIRGLLCHNCNKGLGDFLDDINLLEKAIQYLKEHEHS